MISKILNVNLKIDYKSLPEDDPLQRKPDIKLANKILRWSPKVELNEGLNKTISYFKEIIIHEKK